MQTEPSTMRITRSIFQISAIIGDSPETTKNMFDPREDRTKQSSSLYIVPDNQRFDAWTDDNKKSALIDSVMKNYPMPSFVMSRHRDGDKDVHHIQDGQQRLRTFQKYILGKFPWNGKKFSELSRQEERNFLTYQINCDIIADANRKELSVIFERINSGKPLTDNDKYHNRIESNVLTFIMKTLIIHPELSHSFATLCGPIGAGKKRAHLKDIVGAVMMIIKNSVHHMKSSYDVNGFYLEDDISENVKQRVVDIFKDYFQIVSLALNEANVTINIKKNYIKLGMMLGLFVFCKISGDNLPVVTECCWKRFALKCQDSLWAGRLFTNVMVLAGHGYGLSENILKHRIEYLSQFNDESDEFPKVGPSSSNDSDDDDIA
jgi:hypothetical protein